MTYDSLVRLAEPGEDDTCIDRIELTFAIPVWLTHDHQRMLHELAGSICDYEPNIPKDGVHWPSGYGSKPNWSKVDAAMLGLAADPDAPESGEPTFDNSVLFLETCAREFVTGEERERKEGHRTRLSSAEVEFQSAWNAVRRGTPGPAELGRFIAAARAYAHFRFDPAPRKRRQPIE